MRGQALRISRPLPPHPAAADFSPAGRRSETHQLLHISGQGLVCEGSLVCPARPELQAGRSGILTARKQDNARTSPLVSSPRRGEGGPKGRMRGRRCRISESSPPSSAAAIFSPAGRRNQRRPLIPHERALISRKHRRPGTPLAHRPQLRPRACRSAPEYPPAPSHPMPVRRWRRWSASR